VKTVAVVGASGALGTDCINPQPDKSSPTKLAAIEAACDFVL
jgi:hypothetical protein